MHHQTAQRFSVPGQVRSTSIRRGSRYWQSTVARSQKRGIRSRTRLISAPEITTFISIFAYFVDPHCWNPSESSRRAKFYLCHWERRGFHLQACIITNAGFHSGFSRQLKPISGTMRSAAHTERVVPKMRETRLRDFGLPLHLRPLQSFGTHPL